MEKTIKYIDEEGLKEIFRIIKKHDDDILAILNGMSNNIQNMNTEIINMKNTINTTQEELNKISFDMGQYS